MSSSVPIIRLSHPLAFAKFLQHIGAPVDRHMRGQNLPTYYENTDAFVPLRKAWAFFDATAQSEDPTLGWHVGRYVGDHNLHAGLLSKCEHAPTLYQALKSFIRMISSEASHLQLGIVERPDDILFCTHYSAIKDWPGYLTSQAYQLVSYLNLIRHFAGRNWVPEEIGTEYPVVPRVAEGHFRGCRILTSQRMGYIAVPRSCLHLAAPTARHQAEDPTTLVLTASFDYIDTIKTLLRSYLSDGYPSASLAASLMDTSVRTLARRLSERGVTYRGLVDEVRFSVARELLLESEAQLSEVGAAVGFDNPSNFARMFRRIGGLSPRQYRQAFDVSATPCSDYP